MTLRCGGGPRGPGALGQFERGPREYSRRGTATDHGPAFVVEDGDYVSARWPGDAYLFTERFRAKLEARAARG